MSRYKDQIPPQDFKEKAKQVTHVYKITKALIDKEMRNHQQGSSQVDEKSQKAMKKYVAEYLSRHGIN